MKETVKITFSRRSFYYAVGFRFTAIQYNATNKKNNDDKNRATSHELEWDTPYHTLPSILWFFDYGHSFGNGACYNGFRLCGYSLIARALYVVDIFDIHCPSQITKTLGLITIRHHSHKEGLVGLIFSWCRSKNICYLGWYSEMKKTIYGSENVAMSTDITRLMTHSLRENPRPNDTFTCYQYLIALLSRHFQYIMPIGLLQET